MVNKNWTIEDSEEAYRVKSWSNGYFDIGDNGHLHVIPKYDEPERKIDLQDVIDDVKAANIEFPMVIRFHDILGSQVEMLNETFREVIAKTDYKGHYKGVFPIKVNQLREVVEEIVDIGSEYDYGLEAGSKAELLAALAYNTNKNSLTILNGYKDEEYLRLSLLGQKLGRNMVVVIEQANELVKLLKLSKEVQVDPIIGLRVKMMAEGQGKWKESSGERAKFGLTIAEVLRLLKQVDEYGMGHCVHLVHFHIGSQLTDIKAIKEATNEAALIYCNLVKMGVPLKYIDVGGGLAIDYDGSCSTNDSSRNYSLKEYVTEIVNGFKTVCDNFGVAHPTIVSESGRAISAHHSCVITKIVGEINPCGIQHDTAVRSDEHRFVSNMRQTELNFFNDGCVQETFNDIEQKKEQAGNAFKLGLLSLEDMASIDTMYWRTLNNINKKLEYADFIPEEMRKIPDRLASMYLANFSVFQSVVDSWAISQVLPVMPIARLNEQPQKLCTLVDITCDSDGKIDRFIGEDNEIVHNMPVHQLVEGEDYFVGIFLTGAYQDVMGDTHNLFGRLNEVHIYIVPDDPKGYFIEEVIIGATTAQVLGSVQYTYQAMMQRIETEVKGIIKSGQMNVVEGTKLMDYYESCLQSYTYLTD